KDMSNAGRLAGQNNVRKAAIPNSADCRKTSRLLCPESHNDPHEMLSFLRRLWTFTRPYQGRLFLGLFFGILYAITNGLLVVIITLTVKVLFAPPGSEVTIAEYMKKLKVLRPFTESLVQALPTL